MKLVALLRRSSPARLCLAAAGGTLAALLVFAAPTLASAGARTAAGHYGWGHHGGSDGGSDHRWQRSNDPSAATRNDVSRPLRDVNPLPAPAGPPKERDEFPMPEPTPPPAAPDPALQATPGAAAAPAAGLGFEGVGQGFSGPQGTFTVNSAPPDTNGAVGPNHYVQIVNQSFAIFSKTGTVLYGPAATNTLWAGFGGGCQANDDGDATAVYDRAADRWIISQFSVTTTPFLQCVAVSTSGDPTGTWYRYSFQYANFPDYPKLGVWPDAYYTTFNMFNAAGTSFLGPQVCAYDRAKMLAGAAATQQCFTLSTTYGSLLPSSVDSATPPPAGSPNYLLDFGTNQLELWKFHVDWTTPANSSLTGPAAIPVAAFTPACTTGTNCIPQTGTTQKLDSLGDRLMYRLAYRNFGDHESLVVSHGINAGTSVGMRWYELRSPNGTPTVYQQGTYAPDAAYRWMGSIAQDGSGNIGLGYSISSSTTNPGIRYTGHLTTDPLGVMGQGEGTLINGTGSQLATLARWGDYSAMTVDPVDDCTFWYTNEYLTANGTFNWHTRIGTFTLPGCGVPDFSLAVAPTSATVNPGSAATYTVTVTPQGGFNGNVVLTVDGLPLGSTGTFTPNPTTGTSTLTVTTDPLLTSVGSYPLTITGTDGVATHSTSATLVVATQDFSLSASPSTRSVVQGGSTTYAVTITPVAGFSGSVDLAASGLPAGATASFSPNPATSTSTLSVTTSASTPTGSYPITITGTSGTLSHTTSVTLTVTAPAPNFSLSASPTARTIARGGSTTYAITVQRINGFSPTVSLSVSGLPSRASASFSPNPATSSSTLTITTSRNIQRGTYALTITGTGGGLTRTTSVTLTTQ